MYINCEVMDAVFLYLMAVVIESSRSYEWVKPRPEGPKGTSLSSEQEVLFLKSMLPCIMPNSISKKAYPNV